MINVCQLYTKCTLCLVKLDSKQLFGMQALHFRITFYNYFQINFIVKVVKSNLIYSKNITHSMQTPFCLPHKEKLIQQSVKIFICEKSILLPSSFTGNSLHLGGAKSKVTAFVVLSQEQRMAPPNLRLTERGVE